MATLSGEAARFLVAGVLNSCASFAAYFFLQLFMPYQAAYAIAFALGILASYVANLLFVFRERHSTRKLLAFPLVYLAQYGAGALLLAGLVEYLGFPKEWAPLVVIAITVPVTFVLARFILRSRAPARP